MEITIDLSHPCPACNRYTCRCAEVPEVSDLLALELEGMRQPGEMWDPWVAAFASNA